MDSLCCLRLARQNCNRRCCSIQPVVSGNLLSRHWLRSVEPFLPLSRFSTPPVSVEPIGYGCWFWSVSSYRLFRMSIRLRREICWARRPISIFCWPMVCWHRYFWVQLSVLSSMGQSLWWIRSNWRRSACPWSLHGPIRCMVWRLLLWFGICCWVWQSSSWHVSWGCSTILITLLMTMWLPVVGNVCCRRRFCSWSSSWPFWFACW